MTRLAAIINITPDSFSGDGTCSPLAQAEAALNAGAHMLDIGAQSTRPGAAVIDAPEEISRLRSHLAAIADLCHAHGVRCSVDTYRAETARFAIDAGANVINDVSAGMKDDGEMIALMAANACVDYIFMHHVTVPAEKNTTLSDKADAVAEVARWRDARIIALQTAGINRNRLIFDPGIGFGKTSAQSLALMQAIPGLCAHDAPVMIGHSRKSFLGGISGEADAAKRDPETLAASVFAARHGAAWLRVHAIAEHARALAVYEAL